MVLTLPITYSEGAPFYNAIALIISRRRTEGAQSFGGVAAGERHEIVDRSAEASRALTVAVASRKSGTVADDGVVIII
jgi:hypothetical protein